MLQMTKKQPHPERPRPLEWQFGPDIPTYDFIKDYRLDDPSGVEEAVEDLTSKMDKDDFLAWEAVMAEEQGLPLRLEREEQRLLLKKEREEQQQQSLMAGKERLERELSEAKAKEQSLRVNLLKNSLNKNQRRRRLTEMTPAPAAAAKSSKSALSGNTAAID